MPAISNNRSFILLSLLIVMGGHVLGQPVTFDWAQGMGGKPNSQGRIDITRDQSGNTYITGEFEGTRTFGNYTLFATGFTEVFIAKYDSTGFCLWAKKAGANFSSAYAGGIAYSDGYLYVVGYYTNSIIMQQTPLVSQGLNDIFLAKMDPSNGSLIWFKSFGGQYIHQAYGITEAQGGGVYITGKYSDITNFNGVIINSGAFANIDLFIAKISDNGSCIWASGAGNSVEEDRGYAVHELANGEVMLTGFYQLSAQFDSINVSGIFGQDFFLAKYDQNGVPVWVQTGGSPGGDWGTGIGSDTSGNIYVSGFIGFTSQFGPYTLSDNGYGNLIALSYDVNGNIRWAKGAGSFSNDSSHDLVTDEGGSSYITGYVSGTSQFDNITLSGIVLKDGFVCKISPQGDFRWAVRIGGHAFDEGKAIALDKYGRCLAAGDFFNNATIGNHYVFVSSGNYGVYLTRLGGGTVGLSESHSLKAEVFPIPSRGRITIRIPQLALRSFSLDIYNTAGKLIKSETVQLTGPSVSVSADLSDLDHGTYILVIDSSIGIYSQKIIIN